MTYEINAAGTISEAGTDPKTGMLSSRVIYQVVRDRATGQQLVYAAGVNKNGHMTTSGSPLFDAQKLINEHNGAELIVNRARELP